jgi:hypothetical protein
MGSARSYVLVTLGIYSHVLLHMQQQAADAMDAALANYHYRSSTKTRV